MQSVTLTPKLDTIFLPATVQYTATLKDSAGNVISGRSAAFTTTDATVATIAAAGLLTSLRPGDIRVVATSGGHADSAALSIWGPVASLQVTPATAFVNIGDSIKLAMTAFDAASHLISNPTVTWQQGSVNGFPGTVTAAGLVRIVGGGNLTITAQSSGPAAHSTITGVMDTTIGFVSAGSGKTCAVSVRGTTYCWGNITFAVPGVKVAGPTAIIRAPVRMPSAVVPVSISSGTAHNCLLTQSRTAYCWGSNVYGELGATSNETCAGGIPCSTTPLPVGGGLTFSSLSAGDISTCGVTAAGDAYCWGGGAYGVLGDSSVVDVSTPTLVRGGHKFLSISLSSQHACGIAADSTAWCWGPNDWGQLGNGSFDGVAHSVPEAVVGGLKFVQLVVGRAHTCGATTSNAVYCWGVGGAELGTTSPDTCVYGQGCRVTPGLMTGTSAVVVLATHGSDTCALDPVGAVRCWGTTFTGAGQLGPQVVSGSVAWSTLSVGDSYFCGIATAGAVICQGWSPNGELGEGAGGVTTDATVPVRVVGQR